MLFSNWLHFYITPFYSYWPLKVLWTVSHIHPFTHMLHLQCFLYFTHTHTLHCLVFNILTKDNLMDWRSQGSNHYLISGNPLFSQSNQLLSSLILYSGQYYSTPHYYCHQTSKSFNTIIILYLSLLPLLFSISVSGPKFRSQCADVRPIPEAAK